MFLRLVQPLFVHFGMLELLQRWHLKMAYLRECGAAVHDDLSSPNTGWHQLKDDQKSMLSLYNFKCDQITVDEQSNIIISKDLFSLRCLHFSVSTTSQINGRGRFILVAWINLHVRTPTYLSWHTIEHHFLSPALIFAYFTLTAEKIDFVLWQNIS